MTEHLDFDHDEVSEEPSVVFTLNGRDWSCVSRDVIAAEDAERLLLGRVQVGDFFNTVLVEEDREPFAKMLDENPKAVSLTRFQRLANVLVETIFERPTERSSSSTAGPQSTEATSKAVSSSRGGGRTRRAS